MLGFSLGKLIVLAALIGIVWYAFKYAARIEAIKRDVRAEVARREAAKRGGGARSVEDLVKCAQCGAFVAAQGANNCGKANCPWGR
ncbi:MAG TPA: hypothetical protein VJR47_13825 [Stellaceae bacterium]|nr:hypothetical protein [Stellaceae bacterium]